MIWIILAIAIPVILTIYWMWDFGEIFIPLSLGVIIFILSFLVAALITCGCSDLIDRGELIYEKETTTIIALNDSQDVYGRTGFLGSGYINEQLYYYYVEDTELGYTVKKVRADDAYIKYSGDCKIEKYSAVDFKDKWDHVFAMPMDEYYVIHVPEGTIIENYRIDLE